MIDTHSLPYRTWLSLASMELIYTSMPNSSLLRFAFLDLSTRPSGEKNLDVVTFALTEAAVGQESYLAASKDVYCRPSAVLAMTKAQMRAREMLIFAATAGLSLEEANLERKLLAKEFGQDQELKEAYLAEVCEHKYVDDVTKRKNMLRHSHKSLKPYHRMSDYYPPPDHRTRRRRETEENSTVREDCQHTCNTAVLDVSAWCEGIFIFGANFICEAVFVASSGGPARAICSTGVVGGSLASMSAFCASPVPAASICASCDDKDVDVGRVLDGVQDLLADANAMTLSLRRVNALTDK